jgi:hypothetical protein
MSTPESDTSRLEVAGMLCCTAFSDSRNTVLDTKTPASA